MVKGLMTIVDSAAMNVEVERQRQHVNLDYLCQYVMKELSLKAERRGIDLSLHVSRALSVLGIPAYIQDMYKRVIEYAIKSASPADGRVWIRLGPLPFRSDRFQIEDDSDVHWTR